MFKYKLIIVMFLGMISCNTQNKEVLKEESCELNNHEYKHIFIPNR